MNVHEYQAKELLAEHGIAIPAGHAALTVAEAVEAAKKLPGPLYVVKAQIHAGGRGKGVLSGKVYEYIAAGRPILAVVPPDGAAAKLVRETSSGVVVAPVIGRLTGKGVLQIAQETSELAKKARDGKLGPADMQGGCFSISSLGGIGGTSFTPIVNAPEVAILGVSKSATKPVWDGKQFAPRLLLPLSLSYDHRVIDGAAAARFTATLGQLLADMRRTLL